MWQKKDIERFKLSLDRGINSTHEFQCTGNTVCMHVTCMVVTLYAICEGLVEGHIAVFWIENNTKTCYLGLV